MTKLTAYETFENMESVQYFKNIRIEIDFPFSQINFKDIEFELALQITSLKFLSGFNDFGEEDRIIYLNKKKIKNEELFIWEDEHKIENFIKKYKNILNKENIFTIKLKNKNQYEYIKHIMIIEE